ncbi:Disease resistance protein RPS4B [Cardamine amara subsp. amara]|uniref:Disease resistance protein RPS4B n=1 Tax=Cardamine amara subsp. amara TaxID=228776 RepID=A0ABD1BDQ8_CARAN
MAESSTIEELPPKHQVFISYRGEVLVHKFVAHLYRALRSNNIKVFIDNAEVIGQQLQLQFRRIEESTIALVIFSGKYPESTSCLRELARIKDSVDEGKMKAIPIFYKLDPSIVKGLKGQFGDAFRYQLESPATKKMWKKALKSIAGTMGFKVDQYR